MTNSDTSDSRLAECEKKNLWLSSQLEELTDFFENAALPLRWVDAEGRIIRANRAELDFLGYDRDEYIGSYFGDYIVSEGSKDDIRERLGRNETLINYEATLRCRDGSLRDVLINSNVYSKNGEFIHTRCFTRDITLYKQQQLKQEELMREMESQHQAMQESEQRFSSLANSAPVLLWMSGTDRQCFFFNSAWLKFTGRTMEQENGSGWMQGIHPEDLPRCLDKYHKAFEAREEFPVECRLMRHDGQYRWVAGTGVPRFTPDGEFLGFVGSSMDVHDQKNFAQELEDKVRQRTEELRMLNALLTTRNRQLQHSNEELSSFSYAASHDLQAPLRKINTFSSFIAEKDGEKLSGDSRMFLSRITLATERMQNLIDSLLDYSRINADKNIFERTDLMDIFREVKTNLADLIEESQAEITVSGLPVIEVIPLQFQQLFVNLISNSVKYSKKGIRPKISITASVVPGADIVSLGGNPDLEYHKLTFEDNGIGFEQEYAEKIFELFHRLHGKNEYEGTGVGLGIVRKIVLNHKGFVKATGVPDEGAVFDIYIPASGSVSA